MIFHCATCGTSFKRDKRRAKHCSNACRKSAMLKLTADVMRNVASTGCPVWLAALMYGVREQTIRDGLVREGVYEQWREARYA